MLKDTGNSIALMELKVVFQVCEKLKLLHLEFNILNLSYIFSISRFFFYLATNKIVILDGVK
jgi:hypothetical protein